MLSRTADHLFWMARYVERAENTARMLDVNVTTSLLPMSREAAQRGWRAMLGISELQPAFDARFAALTPHDVLDFMVRDPSNQSSIISCLQAARENARAVRGTMTTDVWETHNDTWLQLQQHLKGGSLQRDPHEFFEWVKFRSHLSRGVTIGTMLKDEAFYFIRLGSFLERADNTARILDVKFHGADPADSALPVADESFDEPYLDFYYWAAVPGDDGLRDGAHAHGIGPQTASRILAEMHDDEEAFYRDLLEAKIRFVTTRQFWGN